MHRNQHHRQSVGGRTAHRTHPPSVAGRSVIGLHGERARDEDRRRRNETFRLIADGLPCGRPHAAFDNVGSASREAERRPDPCGDMMRPIFACVDAAVATGSVGVVLALLERIDTHLAELRVQCAKRVPPSMAQQVFGPLTVGEASAREKREDAEADVAEAHALLHPEDPNAVEAARRERSEAVRAGHVLLDALHRCKVRGGRLIPGFLMTRA